MKWQILETIQKLPKRMHILGELYHLKYVPSAFSFLIDYKQDVENSNNCSSKDQALTIDLPEKWFTYDQNQFLQKFEEAVDLWLTQQLKSFVLRKAPFWLDKMQTHVHAWQFKKLKATWGLCRLPSRVICLNTSLFHFSPICIEAVLVHELSHLFYANHGRQFYQHLLFYFPDYKKAKQMLRQPLHIFL
jgi:predicted metal-dependent hydrolase